MTIMANGKGNRAVSRVNKEGLILRTEPLRFEVQFLGIYPKE
jgi:hypothetical protein